ncbi:MAG: hypothetical protein V7646_1759 [Pseudonocardia sp.]|jgi:hypothetical protein
MAFNISWGNRRWNDRYDRNRYDWNDSYRRGRYHR